MLLLDDLALMPLGAQAAILRVMETGRYRPLGAKEDATATCRTVFATTIAPEELVASGRLLCDLEGRLGQLFVPVPPLSARKEDIMPIAIRGAQSFIDEHGLDATPQFDEAVQEIFLAYAWPGNVRELRDVVERAVVHAGVCRGAVEIRPAHLPGRVRTSKPTGLANRRALTVDLVEATLRQVNGNRSEAARQLGVHRNTIGRYLSPDSVREWGASSRRATAPPGVHSAGDD
jgi:DNA-binding NtrC family response regulator